jgi:hypothetical protein
MEDDPLKIRWGPSPLCIFKRPWYDSLFDALATAETSALTGSPKSTLQFHLLYEFVKNQCPWRRKPSPRVVTRHEGDDSEQAAVYYFLEEGLAVQGKFQPLFWVSSTRYQLYICSSHDCQVTSRSVTTATVLTP